MMKNILIAALAKILFNDDLWRTIRDIVWNLSAQAIPGEKKRELAIQELKEVSTIAGKSLLNLGVELAVSQIKSMEAK